MKKAIHLRPSRPTIIAATLLIASSGAMTRAQAQDRSAVTYEEGGKQRIYVFLRGLDNRLYLNYWDGVQWKWRDQGGPDGGLYIGPAVISYQDPSTDKHRIYAFMAAGNLRVNYWNGSAWQWADQGIPPGTTKVTEVAATTFKSGSQQRIYAFVKGDDSKLHVNYWNGSSWSWASRGNPPGTTVGILAGAVTYQAPGTNTRWIHVFVWGADKHLYANYWNGTEWKWTDHGTFPNAAADYGSKAAAITYQQSGTQRIYAFFEELNSANHYVRYRSASAWHWAFEGTPPGISSFMFSSAPRAITYLVQSVRKIYVFATGKPGHLYYRHWNGSQWEWMDRGAPTGTTVGGVAGAVSYLTAGPAFGLRRIYVFVRGENGHLYTNHWNGSEWQWVDRGVPPGTKVGNVTY